MNADEDDPIQQIRWRAQEARKRKPVSGLLDDFDVVLDRVEVLQRENDELRALLADAPFFADSLNISRWTDVPVRLLGEVPRSERRKEPRMIDDLTRKEVETFERNRRDRRKLAALVMGAVLAACPWATNAVAVGLGQKFR
jgi:hypothetical protein